MDNIANLPDDVDALKAIVIAKQSQIASLEYLVKAFKHGSAWQGHQVAREGSVRT